MCICKYMCVCVYVCVYAAVCVCVCVFIYMRTCFRVCACVCVCVFMCRCILEKALSLNLGAGVNCDLCPGNQNLLKHRIDTTIVGLLCSCFVTQPATSCTVGRPGSGLDTVFRCRSINA